MARDTTATVARISRRRAVTVVAGALTVPVLRRHVPAAAETGGTGLVRFAWWSDVGAPTPFQVSAVGPGGAVLLTLIYDTLVWKDDQGIVPWLATEWEASGDGLTYTFHLWRGATWQDGQPLTAHDVAFTFDYYARHPYVWMGSDVVASAAAEGDDVIRIALTRPNAAFLHDIAGVVPIVPRHIWETVADPIAYEAEDRFVGSGPFRLVEFDQAAGAYRLLAHDDYWRGQPLVREWQQVRVPPEVSVQAIQQDNADVSLSTDASVRELLTGDAGLTVHETAPLSVVRLAVNTERPPLDQESVRQAIAYALDRALIAETITHGPAIVGSAGVIPPETPWYNPGLAQYGYKPDRARELLGGRTYEIGLIADANTREPDLIVPMLEAVGINLTVQRVDAATRAQLLQEGDFDLALTGHIGIGGDPDYLRRWYAGEEANAFAQGSIFHDEEFARLGGEQATTVDTERRREIVFRMQEIMAEKLPTIVLYYRRFYWIYNPAVFTPMETWGGLMNGVPFPNNKLALIEG